MSKIDSFLKGANLYSIEYVGFLILKFTISDSSIFYNEFNDISIEFISGHDIKNNNLDSPKHSIEIFELYGLSISYSEILNDKRLLIRFENGLIITSKIEVDVLIDRNWMINVLDSSGNYILNDANELFSSNDMIKIIANLSD